MIHQGENVQLKAIEKLHQHFEANHIDYWLFGGWAVDFHLGSVSRSHSDIDVAIWYKDVKRIVDVMKLYDWKMIEDENEGVLVFKREPILAEFALLEVNSKGRVYTPTTDGQALWPENAFGDDARIMEGVTAHVISLAALIEDKSAGYGGEVTQTKDREDLTRLLAIAKD